MQETQRSEESMEKALNNVDVLRKYQWSYTHTSSYKAGLGFYEPL